MKLYLPFLCIAISVPASITARTMIVSPVNAEPKKLEVTTGTRITFSKDKSKMIVTTDNSGNSEFEIEDIANIIFTIDSSVDCIGADFDDLNISNNGGIVTITATGTIQYSVWNLSGNHVAGGQAGESVTIDFTSRAAGVYIIKANNKTVKFINR